MYQVLNPHMETCISSTVIVIHTVVRISLRILLVSIILGTNSNKIINMTSNFKNRLTCQWVLWLFLIPSHYIQIQCILSFQIWSLIWPFYKIHPSIIYYPYWVSNYFRKNNIFRNKCLFLVFIYIKWCIYYIFIIYHASLMYP